MWKARAKSIGADTDLITLHFKTLMDEKTHNYRKLNGRFACVQAIYGSVVINEEKLCDNSFIDCYVFNKSYSKEQVKEIILNFLNKIDCKRVK